MPISRFLGSWTLASWRIAAADGGWRYPLGTDAEGLLVYAPDGYMFAALMAAGPARFPRQRSAGRQRL